MRRKGFNMSAVRYEDLVARPLETCRQLMEFCGLPVTLAEFGVRGLECDSQRNSPVAKSIIGQLKEPDLTPESEESLNRLLKQFGLPPIGHELILDGTIGRNSITN
jgi:hypothetical protein